MKSDALIIEGLKKLQPTPKMDLQKTVSAEKITGVTKIPSGACTGELIESDPNDWKDAKCTDDSGSAGSGGMAKVQAGLVVAMAAAVMTALTV